MTPIEEWEALHAAVTDMVKIAEATTGGWLAVAHPERDHVWRLEGERAYYGQVLISAEPQAARFVAAHDPSWALSAHREALDRLNRHRPIPPEATQTQLRSACAACLPSVRPWVHCPEVAGLRFYVAKEGTDE